MKTIAKSLFALSAVALMTITGCSKKTSEYDSVIYGTAFVGNNGDKTVEAIVIKDGKIVYSGDKEGAKEYEKKAAKVTTLGEEEFVMPGIIDGHSHPAVAWDGKINALMLEETWSLQKYLSEIKKYVDSKPNDIVYRVKGYIESKFETPEEKGNPKALLDAICSTKPIVATDAGGHGVWCNTKAIEMVSEKFPEVKLVDPDHPGQDTAAILGGTIERSASGEAIGFFRDKGTAYVNNACVKFTKEGYLDAIIGAQEEYASLGYTSYNEAMINESADVTQTPKLEAYKELESKGKLTSYVASSFIVGNRDDSLQLVDRAIALRDETKGGNFEVTDIKIFMDGVVEGGSAYLKEPYARTPSGEEGTTYRGSSSWANDLDKLAKVVEKANNAGMPVHFHAIGDQASLDAVGAIEAAAATIGVEKVKACRNMFTHLQIVDPSIYQKFHDYNIVANLNPWASKGPGFYEETEVYLLGEKRASQEYPYKSFLNNGVHVSFGTDYGSSFMYHPTVSFVAFTQRKYSTTASPVIDDSTQLNPSECLSRVEALDAMTSGGAYQLKKENSLGTLEVGKDANLVVFNKSYLTVADKDAMSVVPQKTMFQGKWVYEKSK